MTRLNLDLGELPDEPEELFALADLVNVACGGHAGDAASMRFAARRARGRGLGAHPSYPDRAGFGRTRLALPLDALRRSLADQCGALAEAAAAEGAAVGHVKPHGALYHACEDPEVAAAVLDASREWAVIGPPALLAAARARGREAWTEGFADRGVGPDGRLIPRGSPGALLHDPAAAAARARALRGTVDTICVHGDSPGALAIARAVRAALDAP